MVVIEAENNISSLKTQLLANYVFTDELSSLSLSEMTPDFDPFIREIIEAKEFAGKDGTICVIHNIAGSRIKRTLLLGMGDKKNLNPEKTRNLTGKVVKKSKELGISEFVLNPFISIDKDHLSALVEGIKLTDYSFDNYKREKDGNELSHVRILVRNDLENNKKIIQRSAVVSDAVIFTRNLSNLPPNDCSPKDLATFAMDLSKNQKLKVSIIERPKWNPKGLEVFWR